VLFVHLAQHCCQTSLTTYLIGNVSNLLLFLAAGPQVPPARYAVREFPGFVTDAEIKYQKAKLLASIEAAGYSPLSQGVTVAQYNPPYTLPTYKRNEVMVKVGIPRTNHSLAALPQHLSSSLKNQIAETFFSA
jgi:hypothetical protein